MSDTDGSGLGEWVPQDRADRWLILLVNRRIRNELKLAKMGLNPKEGVDSVEFRIRHYHWSFRMKILSVGVILVPVFVVAIVIKLVSTL